MVEFSPFSLTSLKKKEDPPILSNCTEMLSRLTTLVKPALKQTVLKQSSQIIVPCCSSIESVFFVLFVHELGWVHAENAVDPVYLLLLEFLDVHFVMISVFIEERVSHDHPGEQSHPLCWPCCCRYRLGCSLCCSCTLLSLWVSSPLGCW